MTDFLAVLKSPSHLTAALKAVRPELTARQLDDLGELYANSEGFQVVRDSGNRVRGPGVHSASRMGAYLTRQLGGIRPRDLMMWIGVIHASKDRTEHWKMRPEVRTAIRSLGWF